MIGLDNIELHKAIETRRGKKGEPYAKRTCLGWVARGPTNLDLSGGLKINVHHAKVHAADETTGRFLNGERLTTEHRRVTFSKEDLHALGDMEDGTPKLPSGKASRKKKPELPYNQRQANLELETVEWQVQREDSLSVAIKGGDETSGLLTSAHLTAAECSETTAAEAAATEVMVTEPRVAEVMATEPRAAEARAVVLGAVKSRKKHQSSKARAARAKSQQERMAVFSAARKRQLAIPL